MAASADSPTLVAPWTKPQVQGTTSGPNLFRGCSGDNPKPPQLITDSPR
jgi:hypothetical protein